MKFISVKLLRHSLTRFTILLVTLFALALIIKSGAKALSWTYPNFDVEININKDSSFTVRESSTFIFNGELNGLRRDITLHDEDKSQYCASSGNSTCGGFEFLTINSVTVDGEELDRDEFKIYEVTDEFTSDRSMRIEKRLYPEAKSVSSEEHSWIIEYTVYGGIQKLFNESQVEVPYFYWNVLPEDRGGITKSSRVTINLPDDVIANNEKAFVYTRENVEFYTIDSQLVLESSNLASYTPVTVSYEFSESEIFDNGSVNIDFINPALGVETYFNGNLLPSDFGGEFEFTPIGKQIFEFKRFGYEDQETKVNVKQGEISGINVDLEPGRWMQFIISTNYIFTILGLIAIPIAIYYAYRRYRKYGVDENREKTIVPEFSPPENVRPYLLGSLIDEKVDKTDITGTIIDLAYRGFIKIKEIKKNKDYELTKLDGKKAEELDHIEEKIMDILFGKKDVVNTKDFTYTKVKKFFNLKNDIYQEMLDRHYFDRNPESTRNSYLGGGIALFVIGIILTIGGSVLITFLIGNLSLLTMGLALTALGIIVTGISKYMPAKTKTGSMVYAHVLGFKMYLHTAERYRLEDLTPEEFEKYLSYAVVLGIEKEWAKSFKGIYKQTPDWYEGSGDIFDAYLLSGWVRSFNNSTNTQFTKVLKPSTGSGSGWSGGGSFGGFSGGGGGGGSSGGW